MNSVGYCNECGGEIVGITCSACYKRFRITRDIGRTKKYLQEKICDAKKGGKVDSVFYDKEFVKDITGVDKFGRAILCSFSYWNYEKIIKRRTVKRKSPKSVIDVRGYHCRFSYLDKDKLRFKKKVRMTTMHIKGIEFFVDIGFGDKKEKDLIVVSGFASHVWNNKNRKKRKKDVKKWRGAIKTVIKRRQKLSRKLLQMQGLKLR